MVVLTMKCFFNICKKKSSELTSLLDFWFQNGCKNLPFLKLAQKKCIFSILDNNNSSIFYDIDSIIQNSFKHVNGCIKWCFIELEASRVLLDSNLSSLKCKFIILLFFSDLIKNYKIPQIYFFINNKKVEIKSIIKNIGFKYRDKKKKEQIVHLLSFNNINIMNTKQFLEDTFFFLFNFFEH